jgi:FlaA1/EpsC-like NDP-sugar epimerase
MRTIKFAKATLSMPRIAKRLVVATIDATLCILTVWLAFYLRLGEWISLSGDVVWQPKWAIVISLLLALPIFIISGFYRAIFRYSGWAALMTVVKATTIYGLIYFAIFTAYGVEGVPRTIGLIQPILLLLVVGSSRAFARFWLGGLYRGHLKLASLPKVLIYGAGVAGRQLAGVMQGSYEMRVVGFLDDDKSLQGQLLNGLPIYSPSDLTGLIETLSVSDVLLALPSVSRKVRNEILVRMMQAKVSVRTLPSLIDLAQGKISITDLRELDIDDLLGREQVVPDHLLLSKKITNKVVLVTGAGGSIGSELCRQILTLRPAILLLIEQSEFALYLIHQELQNRSHEENIGLVPLLASVRDSERMKEIMLTWKPNTVYHAAAYKHVPLVEHNPSEGIKNNVMGTLISAQIALETGVEDFVLVSTDKAVRPTNIMGASKRLAEMVLQAIDNMQNGSDAAIPKKRTAYSIVRFGNVLGSSGSVVPKFRQQIRDGGPVTLTHPEITRYFMTISEAAQLVIQAGAMAQGGEVFVLDMGDPIKIIDLARRMIELSGLTVRDADNQEGDIDLKITGLRPGEKLYEELLIGENPILTSHPRIMKAQEEFIPWDNLQDKLTQLQMILAKNDVTKIRELLKQLVSGYLLNADIVDWVTIEQRNLNIDNSIN